MLYRLAYLSRGGATILRTDHTDGAAIATEVAHLEGGALEVLEDWLDMHAGHQDEQQRILQYHDKEWLVRLTEEE